MEGEVSKDVVGLKEYCRRSEKELNKYHLRCTCDNLASGIDDEGAMRDAIDVKEGVLGGQTPPLRPKIWLDPPPWKIFEQVTP